MSRVRSYRLRWRALVPLACAGIAAVVVAAMGMASGASARTPVASAAKACTQKFTVGMLPKDTADPYFAATDQGAKAAAKQLNMNLIYEGPVDPEAAGQVPIITQWTQQHLNAITISADDPNAVAPALKAAMAAGVKVTGFDASPATDARSFFMEQPTPSELAKSLVTLLVASAGPKANVLELTSTLQAPNQNLWLAAIKSYVAGHYRDLTIEKLLPGNSDISYTYGIVKAWLQAHPTTTAILPVDGAELVGAAQAVDALGLKGKVTIVGLDDANQSRPDVLNGTVKDVVLWNPVDLGYAAMYMVHAQLCGTVHTGAKVLSAGRLGNLQFVGPSTITLGTPLVFTKANIKKFNF
jgi:rhamnose transport system substrate-binding protein